MRTLFSVLPDRPRSAIAMAVFALSGLVAGVVGVQPIAAGAVPKPNKPKGETTILEEPGVVKVVVPAEGARKSEVESALHVEPFSSAIAIQSVPTNSAY